MSGFQSNIGSNLLPEPEAHFCVSSGMHHLLGYIQGEPLSRCRARMAEIICPQDMQQTMDSWEHSLAKSSSYSLEYRIQREDGSMAWVWDMGVLSKDGQGQPIINGVMVDVTGLKQAHESMRRQRDFFQSHYDTLPCGIVRFKPEDDPLLLHANKHTYEILGYTQQELGKEVRFLSVIHPDDYHFVKERLGRVMRFGEADAFIYRIVHKSGDTRWFNATLNMVMQYDNEPALQLIFSDVTEAIRLQLEQKTTYDSIPGGVAKFLVEKGVTFLEGNDRYYKLLGGTREDCHSRALDAVLPGDRLNLYFNFIEQAALRKPVDIIYRCRRFDNDKLVWLHLMGHYVEMRGKAKLYQCVALDITAQKEAQQQLKNERERYRLTMGLSAGAVFEYDMRADVIQVYRNNSSDINADLERYVWERFLGRLDEHDIVHPEDAVQLRSILLGEVSGTYEMRFRLEGKSKQPYIIYRVESSILTEDGISVRVVGTLHNTFQSHKDEGKRQELFDIFQNELSADYEMINIVDVKSGHYNIVHVNSDAFSQILLNGHFATEMDRLIRSKVHPQDQVSLLRNMQLETMQRVLEQGTSEESLYFRTSDAEHRWRWKCLHYSYFRQGRSSLLLKIRDVHDVRMDQQRETARFHMILRERCEKVLEVDAETGEYKLFMPDDNNKYPLDYCSNYNDLVKNYAGKYVLPEERTDFLHQLSLRMVLQHVRRTDKPYVVDFTVRELDGTLSYKSWNTSLCRYEDRDYVLSYISDVTGRVLELREKERDANKGRRIIKDALEAAQQANSAKSEFLSKMSHEIRTPMNAIIGMTDIMANELNNKQRLVDCLAKISSSSRFLLSLINDILDMSRIESGKLSLSQEEFSLDALLEQISQLVAGPAKEKTVNYILNNKGMEGRRFVGDPLRMKQVLLNLLSNAVKFTPSDGKVTLQVKEQRRMQEHSYLLFVVTDTGIGVAEEKLKRIFEPFEQAESHTSNRFGGSGLGLSITRNLVSLMNGHIAVASTPGRGSEFRVELPLLMAGDGDADTAFEEEPVESDYDFTGKRILLVEDNDLNMEIAQTLLEFKHAQVDCAFNGMQGLDKFKASKQGYYDAVLMDIQMPVMNGLDAARNIRSLARKDAQSVPILAMTANAFAEDVEESRRSGMNEHLPKPIEIGKLYQRLHHYFVQAHKNI